MDGALRVISYEVNVDKNQVADALALFEFVGGNSADAIRVAINKSAPRVRTKASRAIRDQVRLQASYVNERLTIRRATRAKLSGAISTPSRGLLMTKFSTDTAISGDKVSWLVAPDEPKQGIRVKVKPKGSASIFKGAEGKNLPAMEGKPFYLVLKNSRQLGIARRLQGSRKVHVFHGPSLSQVFNKVRDQVLPEASEIYETEMLDAIRFLLAKKYPKE